MRLYLSGHGHQFSGRVRPRLVEFRREIVEGLLHAAVLSTAGLEVSEA